jgi:hypothetical protein
VRRLAFVGAPIYYESMIYIYALICPVADRIRYVGKCKNLAKRLGAHISKAKGGHTNHHCAHWIRSLTREGEKPRIVALRELPDNADWQSAEIEEIAKLRASGADLTNSTGGGDGFHHLNAEFLKRRGQTRSKNLSQPEVKARFLATVGASHATPEAKVNHRAGAKLAWADPIKREKMLASMRTPEALARRAEATRRRNADPEFAARHRETMKRISSEPEGRERMRKARDIRWSQKAEA